MSNPTVPLTLHLFATHPTICSHTSAYPELVRAALPLLDILAYHARTALTATGVMPPALVESITMVIGEFARTLEGIHRDRPFTFALLSTGQSMINGARMHGVSVFPLEVVLGLGGTPVGMEDVVGWELGAGRGTFLMRRAYAALMRTMRWTGEIDVDYYHCAQA